MERLTAWASLQHQHIKLSLLLRNQIPLTQPSLFRDFSGCIPRGVHGFGSIWQERQREKLDKRHLQMFFTMESITVYWLPPHLAVQHRVIFIHLNKWPIKFYALVCFNHQNNGGRPPHFYFIERQVKLTLLLIWLWTGKSVWLKYPCAIMFAERNLKFKKTTTACPLEKRLTFPTMK